MIHFELSVEIDAARERVWTHLSNIDQHVVWMDDALAIRFVGSQTSGVGTEYECDTKVLFLRTTDRLRISNWIDGSSLTVVHEGAVGGEGEISIVDREHGCTVFWRESLDFPWWFGGGVGERIARRLLAPIWNGDLANLKNLCETP